jgi:HEAT repeat protein
MIDIGEDEISDHSGSGVFTSFIPKLLNILKIGKFHDKRRVLEVLRDIGPDAAAAVPDLIVYLNGHIGCYGLREIAIEALGEIGPAASQAVPDLIQVMLEPAGAPDYARIKAPRALAQIGEPAAIPALLEAARNPDIQGPGFWAIVAIGDFRKAAEATVPALLAMLTNDHYHESKPAITTTLAAIATADGPAWDALLQAYYAESAKPDEEDWIRSDLAKNLYHLAANGCHRPEAVKVFQEMYSDPNPEIREWAWYALDYLGYPPAASPHW